MVRVLAVPPKVIIWAINCQMRCAILLERYTASFSSLFCLLHLLKTDGLQQRIRISEESGFGLIATFFGGSFVSQALKQGIYSRKIDLHRLESFCVHESVRPHHYLVNQGSIRNHKVLDRIYIKRWTCERCCIVIFVLIWLEKTVRYLRNNFVPFKTEQMSEVIIPNCDFLPCNLFFHENTIDLVSIVLLLSKIIGS